MIVQISYDGYVYLVNRITVVLEVRVLLKYLLEIVSKSPGNLLGWI